MKESTVEYVYAIYPEDYIDMPLYVGRAADPKKRLREHRAEAKNGGTSKKCKEFKRLLDAGVVLNVQILETVDISTPSSAESTWIINLEGQGFKLLNGQGGDMDRHKLISDPDYVKEDWTVELLENLDWQREYFGCRAGEKGACIKGVSVYRVGWGSLRMVHPIKGHLKAGGYGWTDKLKTAVRILTE